MSALKEELYEKTTLYEEMGERHLAEMRQKQAEMDEEVEACSRIYTAKLNELQMAMEAKSSADEAVEGQSWNKERLSITDCPEDFQRTPTHNNTPRSPPPAQLEVTSSANHSGSNMPSYTLEEATEFEYLKNILYQYMMGKEQLTLAKVLTTVVKFNPDQVTTILAHEEKKASILGSILT